MKSLRSVGVVTFLVPTILLIALTAAQSNPVAHANQSSRLPNARKLPLGAPAQLAPAKQKPPVSFAKAAAYDSGGAIGTSVAIGDLNGDGHLDLVVTNKCQANDQHGNCTGHGEVSVLLGNGDGTFRPAVSSLSGGDWATSVVIADVNGDGHPDLVVSNLFLCNICGGGGASVFLGNGDGTFQPPASYHSGGYLGVSVAVMDVNGDGHPDIVIANQCVSASNCNNGSVGVLLGNGDGTFQPAVAYNSGGNIAESVAIADVNGDGHPDIVVSNLGRSGSSLGAVGVLLGNGDGTFQPAVTHDSAGIGTQFVLVADVNGDGHPDLLLVDSTQPPNNRNGSVSVLLGNGDGTFQPAVSYNSGGSNALSVAIADVNGDGKLDLVVANQCRSSNGLCHAFGLGRVGVLLGNGDGTFQAPVSYNSGGKDAVSVVIADVNADGKPDLLVANRCAANAKASFCPTDSAVSVLLNNFTATTTTKITSSLNPSPVNQPVTFTATVSSSSSVPNGSTITFYNGATQIGTGTTANGVASLTTSFSTAGTYTIKASYPGDAFHQASSGTVQQVVHP